jgi:hypothetical protein
MLFQVAQVEVIVPPASTVVEAGYFPDDITITVRDILSLFTPIMRFFFFLNCVNITGVSLAGKYVTAMYVLPFIFDCTNHFFLPI